MEEKTESNEEKPILGKLFNSIPLMDENHLELILQSIDKKTACFILTQAVKHAYHQGIFSLGESEVISKSIRVISQKD